MWKKQFIQFRIIFIIDIRPSVQLTKQINKQSTIHPFYRSSVHLILANLNLNTNESWSSSHASMVGSLTVDCRSNPIQSVTFLHQIISLTLYKKRIIKREMGIRRNKRININFNSIVLTMIVPIFIFLWPRKFHYDFWSNLFSNWVCELPLHVISFPLERFVFHSISL